MSVQTPVLALKGLTGGLSNQRIAMLGLLCIARDRSAVSRFPNQMADYVPRSEAGEAPRLLFSQLFNISSFQSAVADESVSTDAPTEFVPFKEAFPRGMLECFSKNPSQFVIDFMLGLEASEALNMIAQSISSWFGSRKFITLQLRIERDWQEYLLKLEKEGRDNLNQENIIDPRKIFQKIRKSPKLDKYQNVWACCDEDDLILSKEDIKRYGADFDLNIFFKTDLPDSINLPTHLLMRSMIDFTICKESDIYVGLQKSTFSRLLKKMVAWSSHEANHFIYSNIGEQLEKVYPSE